MLLSALAFSVFSEEAEASKISQAELTNALGITDFTEDMLSESITRQEFAKILAISLELTSEKTEIPAFSHPRLRVCPGFPIISPYPRDGCDSARADSLPAQP